MKYKKKINKNKDQNHSEAQISFARNLRRKQNKTPRVCPLVAH